MNDIHANNGKVAIATGAGKGLGIALCECLLVAGYVVAGLSRTAKAHHKLEERFLPIACDT